MTLGVYDDELINCGWGPSILNILSTHSIKINHIMKLLTVNLTTYARSIFTSNQSSSTEVFFIKVDSFLRRIENMWDKKLHNRVNHLAL